MGSAVPKIVKIKHFPLQINCIQSLTATMRISFKSEEVIVTLDFNHESNENQIYRMGGLSFMNSKFSLSN